MVNWYILSDAERRAVACGRRRYNAQRRAAAAQRRERVAAMLAEGTKQKDIAAALGVSPATVCRDVDRLMWSQMLPRKRWLFDKMTVEEVERYTLLGPG